MRKYRILKVSKIDSDRISTRPGMEDQDLFLISLADFRKSKSTNADNKNVIARYHSQFLVDLENSNIIPAGHVPSDAELNKIMHNLRGGTISSEELVYNEAGTTYEADETSSVVKYGVTTDEPIKVLRDGKAIELKKGQKAKVGDTVSRVRGGWRVEGFLDLTIGLDQEHFQREKARIAAEMEIAAMFGNARNLDTDDAAVPDPENLMIE